MAKLFPLFNRIMLAKLQFILAIRQSKKQGIVCIPSVFSQIKANELVQLIHERVGAKQPTRKYSKDVRISQKLTRS